VLAPGDLVAGMYRVKRLLGQGGMGQVWEGFDELLCRKVAIKSSWPGFGSGCLVQEGQALAALHSLVVPDVYLLAHHGSTIVLVMERVPGRTLERVLEEHQQRKERIPLEVALGILGGLAAALDVIHAAGIAHHDLKPANIMLAPRGRVVLLDFGIFLPECAPPAQDLVGTPFYLPPEAILQTLVPGQAFLADLYSLGVLAFELLTLSPPFTGRNVIEILGKHVHGESPRLRDLRPDAPVALETLLLELMAKDPLERPAGAAMVLTRLQRISAELVSGRRGASGWSR
jgi:serine/threonine-protein kinase